MASVRITHETIEALRFLETEGLRPGTYTLPDFLILGPQRTGTTWMANWLGRHPALWIPPAKELYFFSQLCPKYRNERFNSARLEWYSAQFRPGLRQMLRRRLALAKRGRPLARFVCGEACASYAAMADELIPETLTLLPEVRVVMILRNPIDRAWSNAKRALMLNSGRSLEEVPRAEFEKFMRRPDQIRCGQPSEYVERWRRAVRPGHLFVDLFEKISEEPADLLNRLWEFVGLDPGEVGLSSAALARPVNTTQESPPPPQLRALLSGLFSEEIAWARDNFGARWEA